MQNFDEIKQLWKADAPATCLINTNEDDWLRIRRQRAKRALNTSMQFFWASFIYQLIVYALLSHIIIKYQEDTPALIASIVCMMLYVPFTVVLLKNFKRMANNDSGKFTETISMQQHVNDQYLLLAGFFRFKKWYEAFLIPLSSAYVVWISFRLFTTGGLKSHPVAAAVLFLLVVGICSAAILRENKKNFQNPLKQFQEILYDLSTEEEENIQKSDS